MKINEPECFGASDYYASDPEWHDDMMHAFDTAVNCMESEEFGGDNAERQEAAYREVAKRLRRMAARYNRTHGITK